ncbi:hypothetical protein AAMO2058_001492200 [Amorphochlora amoebiformis]
MGQEHSYPLPRHVGIDMVAHELIKITWDQVKQPRRTNENQGTTPACFAMDSTSLTDMKVSSMLELQQKPYYSSNPSVTKTHHVEENESEEFRPPKRITETFETEFVFYLLQEMPQIREMFSDSGMILARMIRSFVDTLIKGDQNSQEAVIAQFVESHGKYSFTKSTFLHFEKALLRVVRSRLGYMEGNTTLTSVWEAGVKHIRRKIHHAYRDNIKKQITGKASAWFTPRERKRKANQASQNSHNPTQASQNNPSTSTNSPLATPATTPRFTSNKSPMQVIKRRWSLWGSLSPPESPRLANRKSVTKSQPSSPKRAELGNRFGRNSQASASKPLSLFRRFSLMTIRSASKSEGNGGCTLQGTLTESELKPQAKVQGKFPVKEVGKELRWGAGGSKGYDNSLSEMSASLSIASRPSRLSIISRLSVNKPHSALPQHTTTHSTPTPSKPTTPSPTHCPKQSNTPSHESTHTGTSTPRNRRSSIASSIHAALFPAPGSSESKEHPTHNTSTSSPSGVNNSNIGHIKHVTHNQMSGYYDRQPGPHDFQSSEEGGAGGVDGRPNERGNTPRRRISSLSYQAHTRVSKWLRVIALRVCIVEQAYTYISGIIMRF